MSKPVTPVPPEKVEQPAADDRDDDAEQNVDDGALARGADDLARDQAQP